MDGNGVDVFSELRHFSGNGLPVLCMGEQRPEYAVEVLGRLQDMFARYARSDYLYRHTDCFNPDVAQYFKHQVEHALTTRTFAALRADIAELIDQYAVEIGNPEETSAARDAYVRKLFGD